MQKLVLISYWERRKGVSHKMKNDIWDKIKYESTEKTKHISNENKCTCYSVSFEGGGRIAKINFLKF
jgi:hypothetical protein